MRFTGCLRLVLIVGLSVNVGLTVLLVSKWWNPLVPSAVAVGSFSSAFPSRDWVSNGRAKGADPAGNGTKTKKETGEQACVRNSACVLPPGVPARRRIACGRGRTAAGAASAACPTACMLWCAVTCQ